MARANRRYKKPHYDIGRVHSAANTRDIVVTGKASHEALSALPTDIVDIDLEIQTILRSLVRDEFMFSEKRTRTIAGSKVISWVDVYRIDFEGLDLWLKLKVEQDSCGDYVLVISFHNWDETRSI